LCISGSELIRTEANPNGFVSESAYRNWIVRKRINRPRRGGGEGRAALIEVQSLPTKCRKAILEKYGDINIETEKQDLLHRIIPDQAAADFFAKHKIYYMDNEKGLPLDTQEEYVNNASILNAIIEAYNEHAGARKRHPRKPLPDFWRRASLAVNNLPETYRHSLPGHPKSLQKKIREYRNQGYACLISKKFANVNTVKITDEAGEWLVAQWMNQVDRVTSVEHLLARYNNHAKEVGWKQVKSSLAVRKYLFRPEIERIWYAHRYGELNAKERYQRQHRTILPAQRDALWYSDGTKLNFFFRTPEGKTKTWQVYEVADVYSEVLLGYHISETEDFEAQYFAYKMAIQTSGYKPYEIKYDNQGGHKKGENSDFLFNLARHAIKTTPYNGKSKTIESIFGRFQAQFLKRKWYFTGQNITAQTNESRGNIEFILENSDLLPSLEEVKEVYRECRDEWNNAPHPKTGISRMEMYRSSANEGTIKVGTLEMLDMFGMTTGEPSTYTSSGIEIQVKNKCYAYEVLLPDKNPDRDFNRRNIRRRFYVRYDLSDMSSVLLYEGENKQNLRFIAIAEEYWKIHRDMQSQTGDDLHFIRFNEHANRDERIEEERMRNAILEKHDLHPNQHGLKTVKPKGLGKRKSTVSLGELQKEQSNISELEEKVKAERKAVRKMQKEEEAKRLQHEEEQREFSRRHRQMMELNIN
jgi:hypothetical protein